MRMKAAELDLTVRDLARCIPKLWVTAGAGARSVPEGSAAGAMRHRSSWRASLKYFCRCGRGPSALRPQLREARDLAMPQTKISWAGFPPDIRASCPSQTDPGWKPAGLAHQRAPRCEDRSTSIFAKNQYLGSVESTSVVHRSIPPARFRSLLKPKCLSCAMALRLRIP